MKKGSIAATVILSAVTWTTVTNATTLLFDYTEGSGGINFSFEQSSNPIPINYSDGSYTEVPVTDFAGLGSSYSSIIWFSTNMLGQFSTPDFANIFFGDQIYSGPESAPLFTVGVFSAIDENNGLSGTLTVSAVPEPSTWVLMLVGFGTLGFASYRKSMSRGAAASARI